MQRFFRPWLTRTLHESKRVAELLAQLPQEVNVEELVLEAMGEPGAVVLKPKKVPKEGIRRLGSTDKRRSEDKARGAGALSKVVEQMVNARVHQ